MTEDLQTPIKEINQDILYPHWAAKAKRSYEVK